MEKMLLVYYNILKIMSVETPDKKLQPSNKAHELIIW